VLRTKSARRCATAFATRDEHVKGEGRLAGGAGAVVNARAPVVVVIDMLNVDGPAASVLSPAACNCSGIVADGCVERLGGMEITGSQFCESYDSRESICGSSSSANSG